MSQFALGAKVGGPDEPQDVLDYPHCPRLARLLRMVWYFPGFTFPRSIATPDYVSLKMPEAPISTPLAGAV